MAGSTTSTAAATAADAGSDPSSSSSRYHVICLGEVLLDFVATTSNVDLSQVDSFRAMPGGAPANVAVGIQRLSSAPGYQTSFVGCVGNDAFGTKLRRILQDAGVNTSYLATASSCSSDTNSNNNDDIRTTIDFVSVWDDGHKDLCFYRQADRFLDPTCITDDMFDCIATNQQQHQPSGRNVGGCLHYGSITLIDDPAATAQYKAMRMAQKHGYMLSYDPNYRPTLWPKGQETTAHKIIFDAFQFAHLVKISQEEFAFVTGHDDLQQGIQAILDQGVQLVIVSRGDEGAVASNGNFLVTSKALSSSTQGITVVETTGAGDAFTAAMISKLLPEFYKHGGTFQNVDQSTVQEALDYANVVAGLACTKPGAISALPTANEVKEFLEMRTKRQEEKKEEKQEKASTMKEYASMVDHTFLKPYNVTSSDMETLCSEARQYGFAMVAVHPAQVATCRRLLDGSHVRVGAAIAFPLGQCTSAVKAYEIQDALDKGADEIDMVINVRALQEGNLDLVRNEVVRLVQICRAFDKSSSTSTTTTRSNASQRLGRPAIICKVILETCYLTQEQKITACEICRDAGVDFVKTSTGFGSGGATVDDVRLLRRVVGKNAAVKASGGIRDLRTFRAMVDAGATRIGTSHGVDILQELLREEEEEEEGS